MGPEVSWKQQLLHTLPYMVLVLIVAAIYVYGGFRTMDDADGGEVGSLSERFNIYEAEPDKEWAYTAFDVNNCCGRDQKICLCGWCCPWIRWADTLSQDKVQLIGFWPALLIPLICHLLDIVTAGLSGVIFLCVAVYFRQQLRKVFGVQHGTLKTVGLDCLLWWCCCPCAAIQEARQVQYARVEEPLTAASSERRRDEKLFPSASLANLPAGFDRRSDDGVPGGDSGTG